MSNFEKLINNELFYRFYKSMLRVNISYLVLLTGFLTSHKKSIHQRVTDAIICLLMANGITRISHKRSLRYYQNLSPAYSLSVLDAVSIMTVR